MRYFFNLAGAIHDPDNEGMDLPNIGAARKAATTYAGEFLRDQPDVVWMGDELRIEVTNADRLVLFTLIVLGIDAPTIGKQS